SRLTRRPRSVSSRSLRTVQQMQPLASTATSPSTRSTRRWSRLISPYSLMMTALSFMSSWRRSRLSSVVLPLPSTPVINETGSRSADLSRSKRLIDFPHPTPHLPLDNTLAEGGAWKKYSFAFRPGSTGHFLGRIRMDHDTKDEERDGATSGTDRRTFLR